MVDTDILKAIFEVPDGRLEDSPSESEEDKFEPMDCMICGGEETVEYDPENVHVNKQLNLRIPAEARTCSDCGHVFYEGKIFSKILETEEKARGNHYVRYAVNHGQLSKYSLH